MIVIPTTRKILTKITPLSPKIVYLKSISTLYSPVPSVPFNMYSVCVGKTLTGWEACGPPWK